MARNPEVLPAIFVSQGAPTLPFEAVAARDFLRGLGGSSRPASGNLGGPRPRPRRLGAYDARLSRRGHPGHAALDSEQSARGPAWHWALGEALRPLRDDGVLILASGSATHNLREFGHHARDAAALGYAVSFNDWLAAAVAEGRRTDLLAYRSQAPDAVRNHPTEEHLLPLVVAAGAGSAGPWRTAS